MGSRVQTIAKIIFALAFVAILAVMNSNILNLGNNANKKLNSTISLTDSYDVDNYDNAEMSGDMVIAAIKNGKNISSTSKIEFVVCTKQNTSGAKYGYVGNGSTFTSYNVSDATNSNFINPSADFVSQLVTNTNGVVTQIVFTQQ